MLARGVHLAKLMRRRVTRRADGLVQIRRASWRDLVASRDLRVVVGLFVAWLAVMALMFAAIVISPLGAIAFVVLPILWVGTLSPAEADAKWERGRSKRRTG